MSSYYVLGGKPRVAGTRISVEQVMGFLVGGMSEKEILDEYPTLKTEDIKAVLEYVAARVAGDRVYPVLKKSGELVFTIGG